MYATLRDFLKMSPEDQRRVTFLDLSVVDDDDLHRTIDKGHDALAKEEKDQTYGEKSQ